ncbi:MAG: hypothetical protein ABIH23_17175 [bacterium]
MQRAKRRVESALSKKGFKQDERKHHFYIYHTLNGKRTSIHTHTSHGSKTKDLGASLLNEMARQCRLEAADFLNLVDCPLDQDAYEAALREAGLLP